MNPSHISLFEDPLFNVGLFAETPVDPDAEGDPPPNLEPPVEGDPPPNLNPPLEGDPPPNEDPPTDPDDTPVG
ncbi:MAG: hypothetical protein QOE77_158 [Blastocatellia bacterium]|jgi:hypothetical protein|nr:hypothetical protein [Blastocatellia bacterium]